mmetsp:Transcript_53834/g.156453  ORF Transcript_53834/g.156453 Transcript_53834/m.156453 type:complete len:162 (+) Transcript_53834:107-592(+)
MKGQSQQFLILLCVFSAICCNAFRPRLDASLRVGQSKGSLLKRKSSIHGSTTACFSAMKFKNFEQVLESFPEEPVVIYFSTSMCGPCKLMKKEVAAVKEMVGDELKMFSIDTEKWPQVGSRFQISRLPCLVVFRGGEVKLRLEGVNSAETVVEQMRSLLRK